MVVDMGFSGPNTTPVNGSPQTRTGLLHKYGKANAGLLDMRFALELVQENIEKFGGNASRVTIAGESSGAGSVLLQSIAYGGREDHLFNNVKLQRYEI